MATTLRSEPSGFSESTRLPLRSRTNKRPSAARPPEARADFEGCKLCHDLSPFIVHRAASAESSSTQGRGIDRPERSFVLRFHPVPRQVGDGDHHEAVRLAEPDQVRHASHGAVVAHDLADHARGVQAREAGEIDGRLSLSPALQDAAGAGAQREHVSRPGEVIRRAAGIDGGPDRCAPVVGRNAGGDAVALQRRSRP